MFTSFGLASLLGPGEFLDQGNLQEGEREAVRAGGGSCVRPAAGAAAHELESPCVPRAAGIASGRCPAHLCEIHAGDGPHGRGDLGQQTVRLGHRAVALSAENKDLIHSGEGSSHFGSDLGRQGRRVG